MRVLNWHKKIIDIFLAIPCLCFYTPNQNTGTPSGNFLRKKQKKKSHRSQTFLGKVNKPAIAAAGHYGTYLQIQFASLRQHQSAIRRRGAPAFSGALSEWERVEHVAISTNLNSGTRSTPLDVDPGLPGMCRTASVAMLADAFILTHAFIRM